MTPLFSVIVPTYERPAALRRCLDALAEQRLADFEVIVVDDGGRAPLEPALLGSRERAPTLLLRQAHAGPAAARNLGLRRARGRFVAFTDDDCRPGGEWLLRLLQPLDVARPVLVGGRTVNGLHANACAEASQLVCDLAYAHHNGSAAGPRFFASNNMACPREALCALGGFDPAFRTAEDRELCDRWLAAGHATAYVPDALVAHEHPLSLAGFCRQQFGYGRGARQLHGRRSQRGSGSARALAAFHGSLPGLLWPRLRSAGPRRAVVLAGLLAVWEAANAAGYLREALRPRQSPP